MRKCFVRNRKTHSEILFIYPLVWYNVIVDCCRIIEKDFSMDNTRVFSDSIKLEVIKNNLKKNNGSICCEICHARLNSIDECHFDHIYPYAKGGKSTFDNCQILCSKCNLSKNDKELKDFVLEEKAKNFLAGTQNESPAIEDDEEEKVVGEDVESRSSKLTKDEFDEIIRNFIAKKGDIHKVDFTRSYNRLPSVWYVREYYGDLNTLKKSFGIEDLSLNWTREKIKAALLDYIAINGDVGQKDLKKKNGLPSYPCIMRYYPEYSSFSTIKQEVLGIKNVYKVWNKEDILMAGKFFVEKNGRLTEKDLKAENGLPTPKVIYDHYGTLSKYQKAIGAPVFDTNSYISREAIEVAVDNYFDGKERNVESRKILFESFPYSAETIYKRYGSFEEFCAVTGIKFLVEKKASYSKKDIDDAIHGWVFGGNDIPKAKDLTKNNLPSMSSIMKYYENWKEPFILYKKIYDEANRNK